MKKNKYLEEIRKEITPEIRKKVKDFVDNEINQELTYGNPCPICDLNFEYPGTKECYVCGFDKP